MNSTVWFAPFGAGDTPLQSPFSDETDPTKIPGAILAAQAFTISLVSVDIGKWPSHNWFQSITQREHDLLVFSTSTRGTNAPVTRVHHYAHGVDVSQPLFAGDFLSNQIHICDDYDGSEHVYLELHVATPNTAGQDAQDLLKQMAALATNVAGNFPALLPYVPAVSLGTGVAGAINTLITTAMQSSPTRIGDSILLEPAGRSNSKILRVGRFVAFNKAVDGTTLKLNDAGEVQGDALQDETSYLVMRIDAVSEPSPDYVLSQRAATLLTGLESNIPSGAGKTALDYLNSTMQAYSDFKDLERYRALLSKAAADRTSPEIALMDRIEKNDALKPYIDALKAGAGQKTT